ncbi:MAG: hypothetical protein J7I99_02705, partial [Methanophagales archaeon]|nr:hypothetical protein [Methanophagales archaeon]
DSAGYDLDQKLIGKEASVSVEEIVSELLKEEEWRQVLSSLVVCFFARKVYTPDVTQKALKALGIGRNKEWTEDDLRALGREIHRAKMNFKFREGFDIKKLRIPHRILEVPTANGMLKEEELREALAIYERMVRA